MNTEAKLKTIYHDYRLRYGDDCRLRMGHANCIKLVIEMAAQVIKPYRVILNQISDQVWHDWQQQVKQDAIRENFLAWGGRFVSVPRAGDLLFICLHYAPVDHLGLCLNADEFVHLGKNGLRTGRIDKYRRRIMAMGRI